MRAQFVKKVAKECILPIGYERRVDAIMIVFDDFARHLKFAAVVLCAATLETSCLLGAGRQKLD